MNIINLLSKEIFKFIRQLNIIKENKEPNLLLYLGAYLQT